jgi:hypothetical protein
MEELTAIEAERQRWSRLRDEAGAGVATSRCGWLAWTRIAARPHGRVEREFSVDLRCRCHRRAGELVGADETLAGARREQDDLRAARPHRRGENLVALGSTRAGGEALRVPARTPTTWRRRAKLRQTIRRINRRLAPCSWDAGEGPRELRQADVRTLFEGGRADVRLVGTRIPTRAPIEIFARPRGKRLANISLLSSGERSLTAVSFLFAIYLVKPSPFCILDEVDAPLDDANIGRFLAMLRKVAERTQFVMITHNKKTMEVADTMYGVTMESRESQARRSNSASRQRCGERGRGGGGRPRIWSGRAPLIGLGAHLAPERRAREKRALSSATGSARSSRVGLASTIDVGGHRGSALADVGVASAEEIVADLGRAASATSQPNPSASSRAAALDRRALGTTVPADAQRRACRPWCS